MSLSTAHRPSFRDVFAHPEFRALWVSYVLSALGDRLALVALTLLVYDRSKSPFLAAITFAAGFVPYLFGGMFLSGLADRLPRRSVMVTSDLLRVILVAAMLAPGVPLTGMIALLYAVTLLQPPFDASRSAIVRDVMEKDRYPLAMAVMGSTSRVVVVAGSAVGGLIVALFGARLALGADAATFVASALLLRAGVHARPAAAPAEGSPKPLAQLNEGIRLVFGDPALRTLMALGWLAAFYEIPEGLAAPYAGSLKGGAVAAGLLIATSFGNQGLAAQSALHQINCGSSGRQREPLRPVRGKYVVDGGRRHVLGKLGACRPVTPARALHASTRVIERHRGRRRRMPAQNAMTPVGRRDYVEQPGRFSGD